MRVFKPGLAAPAAAVLALLAFLACGPRSSSQSAPPPAIEVYFSPAGGATEAVVRAIRGAKEEILLQAYSFTSVPIAKALVDAHKRGVKVTALLDKSQRSEKYSSADFVRNVGIPTYIDDKHAIAHNKVMIVDRTTVITGSFNFTKAAEERNAENLLVIRGNDALARKYLENFRIHLDHSEVYEGRAAASRPR